MNVEPDGRLTIYECDLRSWEDRQVPTDQLEYFHFTVEAQIAAAYANMAGYKVSFVRPQEKPVVMPCIGSHYFSPRKVKKNGWPVAIRSDSPRRKSGGPA